MAIAASTNSTRLSSTDAVPVHVLLRVSGDLYNVGDVVGKHNAVADREGEVWFGKFGKTMAKSRVDHISTQVRDGKRTFLYLALPLRAPGQPRGYRFFRASIAEIAFELRGGSTAPVPSYYKAKGLTTFVSVWFRVDYFEEVDSHVLENVEVAVSGRPVRETLRNSVAGMFFVRSRSKRGRLNRR